MDSGGCIRYQFVGFEVVRNIKFLSDNVYERVDSELDLDNGDIEIDGNVYKLCGGAYKNWTHTIYLVKDMFFEECDDSYNDICNEVVEWADGKYYKQWKYGWLKKLENDNQELKRKCDELKREHDELKRKHDELK